MKSLTATGINNLNTALIIVSALAAWLLPFELFLFSYAVLGPLHYFTEISWLHDRQYYLPTRWHCAPLFCLAFLILVGNTLIQLPPLGLTFLGLGFAVLATCVSSRIPMLIGCVLLLLVSQWAVQFSFFNILFATLLPTLIHVCLFTFGFMLLGSMKSKSISGYVSLLVYGVCAVAVLVLPERNHYIIKEEYFNAANYFVGIANYLTQTLHREFTLDTLTSAFRFIAFSYTYHYLNWFSKTHVISWHKMSKNRAVAIAVLWLASIGLYAVDYKMGLIALLFFSNAHVLLEFPLNVKSFQGIGGELSRLRVKS